MSNYLTYTWLRGCSRQLHPMKCVEQRQDAITVIARYWDSCGRDRVGCSVLGQETEPQIAPNGCFHLCVSGCVSCTKKYCGGNFFSTESVLSLLMSWLATCMEKCLCMGVVGRLISANQFTILINWWHSLVLKLGVKTGAWQGQQKTMHLPEDLWEYKQQCWQHTVGSLLRHHWQNTWWMILNPSELEKSA